MRKFKYIYNFLERMTEIISIDFANFWRENSNLLLSFVCIFTLNSRKEIFFFLLEFHRVQIRHSTTILIWSRSWIIRWSGSSIAWTSKIVTISLGFLHTWTRIWRFWRWLFHRWSFYAPGSALGLDHDLVLEQCACSTLPLLRDWQWIIPIILGFKE